MAERERLYEGTPLAEEERILAVIDAALEPLDGNVSASVTSDLEVTSDRSEEE